MLLLVIVQRNIAVDGEFLVLDGLHLYGLTFHNGLEWLGSLEYLMAE